MRAGTDLAGDGDLGGVENQWLVASNQFSVSSQNLVCDLVAWARLKPEQPRSRQLKP